MALASVMEAIVRAEPDDVRRIGTAYREARTLIAGVAKDAEGSRPRICSSQDLI